ncbi:hypothetical protein [Haladaptatus sp. NG-WS-4]
MRSDSASRPDHRANPTRDALTITLTLLLANTPTLFVFYVTLESYDSTSGVGFVQYLTTTMSGALVFALLWTGIVHFAFGPALAGAWSER